MEELGIEDVMRRKTNLWFLVNFRVHLRADEREQAQPVSFPQQVLLAIGHVEKRILQYLSGDKGSSSESQGLIQSTVCEEPEGNARWLQGFSVYHILADNKMNQLSSLPNTAPDSNPHRTRGWRQSRLAVRAVRLPSPSSPLPAPLDVSTSTQAARTQQDRHYPGKQTETTWWQW